jgi:predicted nucleic acid-binding protein
MVYLDTNILIYASVEQDPQKKAQSIALLDTLISQNQLVLSTLTLQEFAFTMANLGIDHEVIRQDCGFYFGYVSVESDYGIMREAIELCCRQKFCKNINDVMHLLLAQKAKCKRLMSYDRDFRKLSDICAVMVEVL